MKRQIIGVALAAVAVYMWGVPLLGRDHDSVLGLAGNER